MVGIQGIGGIPEPTPERPASVRERKLDEAKAPARDGVEISSEAKEAAGLAQLVQAAKKEPDIRPERVAEAKAAIEREDFKIPEVMAEVAKRLMRYL